VKVEMKKKELMISTTRYNIEEIT